LPEVRGPGPGLAASLLLQPAPGFGERHRQHEARRDPLDPLRRRGERAADVRQAGARRSRRQHQQDERDGQRQRRTLERYGDPISHPMIIAIIG
jgi:hypothetical protein